jgi:hypothetical protein
MVWRSRIDQVEFAVAGRVVRRETGKTGAFEFGAGASFEDVAGGAHQ